LTITQAGDYNVTCTTTLPVWYVFVAGCNNGSSSNIVNIMLLSSPTQVLISDSSSPQLPTSASLNNCTIIITYLNDTMIPAAGDTASKQAHVFVSTAANLALLSVTLMRMLHLEGCFIGIAGNNSGSIGIVQVLALPTSSAVTRKTATVNFDAVRGTSILRLSFGCPPIGLVSMLMDSINRSDGAMFLLP
ncbi:Hypothetical protein, putative, partial [Bodo saltans]